MKEMNKDEEKRNGGISIRLGAEKAVFKPESKKALDLELLLLHIPLFAVIAAFSMDYIPLWLFFLLFYSIAMRIFIGNHDRFHTDHKHRLPYVLEKISEGLAVVTTPWDEPYDSIKWKHLKHHITHRPGAKPMKDTTKDPHAVYEMGGFFSSLFSCLFYEEVQLFLDIKNKTLKRSRAYRLLIYLPLQLAYIYFFGWYKFLMIFLAMRLVGFSAWFVFSWVIHHPKVYHFGFSGKVPRLFKWSFALLHGRRVTEGCIHHATHHAWPMIPYNQLSRFDELARRHPESAPEMLIAP